MRNDGNGAFTLDTSIDVPSGSALVLDLDTDGDGDLDLGGAVGPDGPTFFANDGTGAFSLVTGVRSDGIHLRGRVADLDGDGDRDFVDATRIVLNRHRQLELPWVARIGQALRVSVFSAPGYATRPPPPRRS